MPAAIFGLPMYTGGSCRTSLRERDVRKRLGDAAIEDCNHVVNLLTRHHQWRPERDTVGVEAAQQTVGQRTFASANAKIDRRGKSLLGSPCANQFNSLKQALAADIADHFMFLCQRFQSASQPQALGARV